LFSMCEMVKRHVSARSSIPKAPIDNNSTVIGNMCGLEFEGV